MKINKYLGALILSCLAFHSASAQSVVNLSGNYPVTESWTVSIAEDNGQTPTFSKTYQGTSSGTLAITNGSYTLINKTGLSGVSVSRLDNGRTIYGESGDYEIDGSYPVAGFAGNYAIVQLTFFVVAVKLPVDDFAIPAIDGYDSDIFTTTGGSLTSMSGQGDEIDQNTGFAASASSTAGFNFPAVAPTSTTPPISEVVMAGSDVSFSVGASGTTPFTYEWKHDGTKLSNSGEFSGTTTATLNITNAQTKDAGSYTVVVSNSKGSSSASATLTVYTAQTFTNLYSFTGGSDGSRPSAGLILSGSTLYGTAYYGGTSSNGTVFAVNTDGTGYTNLYSFTQMFTNSTGVYTNGDGANPAAALILSGNTLYGTASGGGIGGYGTVFAVNTDGTGFTTLYSFTNGSDGAAPYAGLILSDNTLYGTASGGGASGYGTVFAINTNGTGFTTVYGFTDGSDGADPYAVLVLSGNTLYGTASEGGSSEDGTIFAIDTNGTGFTNLYSFTAINNNSLNNSDGAYPYAGLILSGNTLYGTASEGGSSGDGTVFAINTNGTGFANLYSFTAINNNNLNNSDGANPYAGLILSGNTLYGTASGGGSFDGGTVFAVNTDGTDFTTLYNFTGGDDGYDPAAGLVLSGNILYGTAYDGGPTDHGTVFSLYVGLPSSAQGSLQVTMAPPGVSAGAEWKVDAGAYQKNAATVTNLSAGAHTVSFKPISGWISPSNQNVTITGGQTTTLTATYLDAAKPTLSITSPKTGQKWSNAMFTVTGKSGDNVAVSNVMVFVTGGSWVAATLLNNGSNWTEQVNLTPGTNTISAYAVDTSGNVSLTNTVKLDYILSAQIAVQIVGSGTLTPNDNGKLLAISNNYTMKATAAAGFGFYYWGGGVPMSTNKALTFTMVSNLSITANFKDVTKPKATITFPVANQKWSNTVITVAGKASDNVGVAGVWVQINYGGWVEAGTGNGYTNWSAANLPVIYGANTVQAYAVDAAGNVSVTNVVKSVGIFAPASLSGYTATVKRGGGKPNVVVTWGDDTWSQAGTGSDANADDYCAGSYTYMQTGPNTAVLTNVDIGMMSAFGTTNVTTVNLTFTSGTSANCAWTNENDFGSGTMTFSSVSNLVPATLAGSTIQINKNSTVISTITLNAGGTFTSTNKNGSHNGTYAFTQYSPTVGILYSSFKDSDDAGGQQYLELTFTSATAGQIFGSYYDSPTLGSNPDDGGIGTFKITQ